MAYVTLLQQLSTMRNSLFRENIVSEYFVTLEEFAECGNPNFLEELTTVYFRDSATMIASMEGILESSPVDYYHLDLILSRLKNRSASIGASKVELQIDQIREYKEKHDVDGFKAAIDRLKIENSHLKEKIDPYFQLKKEVCAAEIAELAEIEELQDKDY